MDEKYQDFLSLNHLNSGIGDRCARGGAYTLAGQMIQFVVRLGSTMILARLLTPADFGIIAMAAVFFRFADMFKDLGLSTALIQSPTINHREVSGLFWIALAICAVLFLSLFAAAPLIANFYQEPRLVRLVQVTSGTFLISGLGLQHVALLRRRMEYGKVASAVYTGTIVSPILAVAAAWAGAGYWALVVMSMSQLVLETGLAWALCPWIPGRPQRPSLIRNQLTFAGFLAGHNFVQYFSRNVDKLIVGHRGGAGELGGYAKAYQFILLPVTQMMMPMRGVVLPALCRLRENRPRLQDFFFLFVKLMVYASVAMGTVAMLFAEEIVAVVLGPQWTTAVPLFRVLSLGLWFSFLGFLGGWVLIAYGLSKKLFVLACITSPLSVVFFLVGSHWGTIGVASAVVISEGIFRWGMLIYACIVCKLNLKRLARCTVPAYLLGMIVMLVSLAILGRVEDGFWLRIGLVAGASVLVVAAALLFAPYRDDVRELTVTVKQLIARKK